MAGLGSVSTWLDQLKAGDRDAAQKLWERYCVRLMPLALKMLQSRRVSRVVNNEEDVALHAFDSFCRAVEKGRFPRLDDRSDLWQVLVMITARKVSNVAKQEGRRPPMVPTSALPIGADGEDFLSQVVGQEPTPEFATQLTDNFQHLLNLLDSDTLRTIALRKFEGCTNEEIASELDCVPDTVGRKLKRIRTCWQQAGFAP